MIQNEPHLPLAKAIEKHATKYALAYYLLFNEKPKSEFRFAIGVGTVEKTVQVHVKDLRQWMFLAPDDFVILPNSITGSETQDLSYQKRATERV